MLIPADHFWYRGRKRQARRGWKRRNLGREAANSVSWVKIDGHQRPWAASRLGQGIAPPKRPRSGGATAAPRTPTQRRHRPSGRAVTRTCRRCPCEAAPRCCVIVPREDFRGTFYSCPLGPLPLPPYPPSPLSPPPSATPGEAHTDSFFLQIQKFSSIFHNSFPNDTEKLGYPPPREEKPFDNSINFSNTHS